MKIFHSTRLRLVSSILIVCIGGCTTLVNPHSAAVQKSSGDNCSPILPDSAVDHESPGLNCNPSMPQAVEYADQMVDSYRNGMGEQAQLTAWTGLILIPLATVAGAMALDGGQKSTTRSLLLGGAGGYALSSWLSNPTRSLVYAAGIEAINCAKQVMLPYSVSTEWQNHYNQSLDKLYLKSSDLRGQLIELHSLTHNLISVAPNDPIVKNAELQILNFTQLLSEVSITLQKGSILKRNLDQSGQTLVFAVDRIAGEVDKALVSTQPSLSALPGIIATLSPSANIFDSTVVASRAEKMQGGGKEVIAAQSRKTVNLWPLTSHMVNIEATASAVRELNAIVRSAVDTFEQSVSEATLKQCGVKGEDIVKALRILPDSNVVLKAGETKSVFLSGGSGQYAVSLAAEVEGLTVTQPVPLGEAVRISTTTSVPPTSASVLVKDVAGQSAIVQITVTAGTERAETPTASSQPASSLNDFEKSLGIDTVREIQTALYICLDPAGLEIDGVIGANTRSAAGSCDDIASETFTAENTSRLLEKYLTDGLPHAGRVIVSETRATKPDLESVYKKLGASETPTSDNLDDWFTLEFRKALKDFQRNHDMSSADKKIGVSGLYTDQFPE